MSRRRTLPWLLTLVIVATSAGVGGAQGDPDELAYERQKALREYFETNDKIRDFGSKPLELLGESKYTKFFERYGNALLVIRVANDFASAKGDEAFKKVAEETTKKLMEKLAPNFMKAVSWFSWAKTGMELFKAFVFDPALEGMNLDYYTRARRAGRPPEEAFVYIRAFGHMRDMALGRFRAEYGDGIFQPGSKDALLPAWENKLHAFANAWFEAEYQKRELEEARRALLAERDRAQAGLPSLDQQLLEMLQERAAEQRAAEQRERQRPPASERGGDFGRTDSGTGARSDPDAPSAACGGLLAAAEAAVARQDTAAAADTLARAEGACAGTASVLARLARLRAAVTSLRAREEQARAAERLCAGLDADVAECRFKRALVTLDGLAGAGVEARCLARRAEIEGLIAREAETVRLLRVAESATGESLRRTRALLDAARAHAPACMAQAIDEAINLLRQNQAWQELLAEGPPAGGSPGGTTTSASQVPSWLTPPTPASEPSSSGTATASSASVPAWLGGAAEPASNRRPEDALDEARDTLRSDHADEDARRRREEEDRRRREQLQREAQERIETERRIADERRRAADEEERRVAAAQGEGQRGGAEARSQEGSAESPLTALTRVLAQAVAERNRAGSTATVPATGPSSTGPTETAQTPAVSRDEAKRACVECVNALISGSCYVRMATLAGWGLCLTCSPDGGVDPANRFIEKTRCPMCAEVSFSLCDFKPAPKGCVPNCCPAR